ncbi:hypothetical protein DEO72_LG2g1856 [Vigna unguiculata]|uniref:Uncharacterized protein n=1 Tax=Vigna unguiculata TaxID=3917 RepID=A0A4D6KYT1_VIGUN|nr:hypothetical protein DEO72_LG2g1856 [Vigna unguiculata]
MTLHSIHYDSTRLIWIRITWSDSADACTCGGYLYSPPSCSPPSYVLQVLRLINFPSPQGLTKLRHGTSKHNNLKDGLAELAEQRRTRLFSNFNRWKNECKALEIQMLK